MPDRLNDWKTIFSLWIGGVGDVEIAPNTVIHHTLGNSDYLSVLFHGNEIMRYQRDGVIRISNGGMYSTTTKTRLNELLPEGWRVYQRAFHWYVSFGNDAWPFSNDMVLPVPLPAPPIVLTDDEKNKLRRQIAWYAPKYTAKLYQRKLPRVIDNSVPVTDLIGMLNRREFPIDLAYQVRREEHNNMGYTTRSILDMLCNGSNVPEGYRDSEVHNITAHIHRYLTNKLGVQ